MGRFLYVLKIYIIYFFLQTLTKHRPRRRSQQSQASRSFPPDTPYSSSGSVEEEAFFQKPSSPTSPRGLDEGDTTDRGPTESIQPAYRERLVLFLLNLLNRCHSMNNRLLTYSQHIILN